MLPERIQRWVQAIQNAVKGDSPIRIMEVCGTHTVSLFRSGVKSLLPLNLKLISGPGCPVCVTSGGYIDAACELAGRADITICTYGDMVRVPGSRGSLETRRGEGAEVRVIYSARDAVKYAQDHPERSTVFLAVGFETTTPGTAAAVQEAEQKGLKNFFILPGHKRVIPAMEALLSSGDVPIDGFLCPGHVSVVIGSRAYEGIAGRYGKPCVVAGFEPLQMLMGICRLAEQIRERRSEVENVYSIAVQKEGNAIAKQMIAEVFEPAPAVWRAMGEIPQSGLELKDRYKQFDARTRFGLEFGPDLEAPGCRCGEVIQGKTEPAECRLFGKLCTPLNPVGPCMVSSEGTCAAWYKYKRI